MNKIVYSNKDYRILASGDVKRNDPDIYVDVIYECLQSNMFRNFIKEFIQEYAKKNVKELKYRRLT